MLDTYLEQSSNDLFLANDSSFFIKRNSVEENQVNIQLALPSTQDRHIVEHFIWKGFSKYYNANIQQFLPNLISIKLNDSIQSALGLRVVGSRSSFIEQYLNSPIETLFENEQVFRKQIGEIGNLYGSKKSFTLRLFIVTALVAAHAGLTKLVFCATPQVKMIMKSLSMSVLYLKDADPKCLGKQVAQWGRYFDTSPEIVAIDLEQAIYLIERSERYSKISYDLSSQIDWISKFLIK